MNKSKSIIDFPMKESKFHNWEDVFANSRCIKIETLNTGKIKSKISGLLNLKNADAKYISEGEAVIPVLAHLISHEKYGDYLIDTGFDSSFCKESGGNFKGLLKKYYFKNRYIQEKASEGIENQLKERDINLEGVFLTHMHEHAAGIPSLPDEIPYVYGKGEREENFFPLVYSDFFKNKTNVMNIDFSKGYDMPIFGKCVDVFEDGSLWALSTPGHTLGHISYLVNGKDAQVLITGDVCITKKGFDYGIETGKFSSDINNAKESLLRIKEFINKYPYIKLIFGHETELYAIKYI